MVNLDLVLLSAMVRLVLGIFLSAVLGFLGWIFGSWLFAILPYNSFTFGLVTVLCVGGLASLGAVISWWDWDTPRNKRLVGIALTVGAALVSGVVTFLVVTNNREFTWIQRGVVFPIINITVLASAVVAGGHYLYRALRRREA